MLNANRFAFKEWAVTCEALATGRQSLLLRKGGIHERHGRFEVEHGEFWLFPTRFHQNPDEVREDARPLLKQVANETPPAGTVRLSLYAVVEEVIELSQESLLPRLADLQILAEQTLVERFHYRRPALYVLPVRIYRRSEPLTLAESPHFAGCRTWVELGQELSSEALVPVLNDAAHASRMQAIRSAALKESA
ncbi:MAG TPA: DUF1802 family protein [Planctomycetaceae bacterium]|jgi:hypothetical protein|nr:DUF1802 family protein [Planctomycetaceae bacterium]